MHVVGLASGPVPEGRSRPADESDPGLHLSW